MVTKMMHDPSGLCNAASSHLGPANTVWPISHSAIPRYSLVLPFSRQSDRVQHASCNLAGCSRCIVVVAALIYGPRDAKLLHFHKNRHNVCQLGHFHCLITPGKWCGGSGAEWVCRAKSPTVPRLQFVFVLQPHLLRN